MNPSFHDTNKLFKALKNRIVETMRNEGDSLFRAFSKEQQKFQDKFEELEKKRFDSVDHLESLEVSLKDSHEKGSLLSEILKIDSEKLEMLRQTCLIDPIFDCESNGLMKFKEDLQEQMNFTNDLMKVFSQTSSMRIEYKDNNTRFVFWNVKAEVPKREFWVDVFCDDGVWKMGEVSDYFFERHSVASLLEKFHDLPGFLKNIRKKFKEV